MEILKFDDSEKSLSSKKPFGRGTILVAFIALVFGAGTALAGGTLSINDTNTIALDQGVATTLNCDNDVDVTFGTNLVLPEESEDPDFIFNEVKVSNIDDACLSKDFVLKVYDDGLVQQVFCQTADDGCEFDGTSATKKYLGSPESGVLSFYFTGNLSTSNIKHITIETTG